MQNQGISARSPPIYDDCVIETYCRQIQQENNKHKVMKGHLP